jgi:hypothetical protein
MVQIAVVDMETFKQLEVGRCNFTYINQNNISTISNGNYKK